MPDEPLRPSATPEWHDQDEGADAASDRTFNPSLQQVNRSREQGLGIGEQEMDTQRDPDRAITFEQYGAGEGSQRDLSPEPGGGANLDSAEALDDVRDQSEGGDQT